MVAPADRTLRELGQELLACAEGALLDAPLDSVAARIVDGDARSILESIHESGEASCLRDLLSGEPLEHWVAANCTAREEQTLAAQLKRWLGVGHAGDDDPARLASVIPPPSDLEGLLAWSRPYGLLGELTRPVAEVLPALGALLPDASLVECCLERPGASASPSGALAAARARDEARAHLVREAAAHAALPAREALWKREPPASLRLLAERLRAILAGTELLELHSVSFVPAHRVSVDIDSGVVKAELRSGDGDAPLRVRLFLSGHEQRALVGECAVCARPGCVHVRALAGRVLDACVDQGDRLHSALVTFVTIPSWRRFMRAVAGDPAVPAAEREADRVGFRVRLDGERVSVAVALRTARAGGSLSAGKLVSPHRVARSHARSDVDRVALDAMTRAGRPLSAIWVPADLAILRSLVEHPFVSLEGGADGLNVVEESVHVALAEVPGGLAPEVSLGGAKRTASAPPSRAGHLVHHDPVRSTLFFAALTPSLRRLLSALEDFRGVLPEESFPEVARWVASLEKVARVSTPKALRGMERPAPEKLLLRITAGLDEGIDVALLARALPLSPLWPPGRGPALAHGLEDGVPVFARRDLESERERAEPLVAALGLDRHLRLEPFAYRIERNQAALELLSKAARLGDALEIEWAERATRRTIVATVRGSDLTIGLSRREAWFRLEGGVRNAGADIAVGRLLDAARRGERFVRVEGHDYVEIERDLFERLERAQLCVTDALRQPAISGAAAPFFLDQLGAQTTCEDAGARSWIDRMRSRAPEAVALPAKSDHLRAYQRAGAAFLIERSGWAPGVCLADEMGLGKTVQAIALLEARAALGPALVVAPTSVVEHWVNEIGRFATALDARAHRGVGRQRRLSSPSPREVIVTSYELLLRDRERFEGIAFATQIVDEAQMVKNARTDRAKATREVDAAFRVALSGTPIENRLGDLWSLFQLIAPDLLGSWARFRARFAIPIERYEDASRAAALRELVAPFILRRTKDEVAIELPSRTEIIHRVELSPAELELYDAAVRTARRAVGRRRRDDSARTVQILAELTRLRQLACHPRLVIDDARLESSKLHALVRLLEDVLPRGHRALLFSQFTRHLALAREALDAKGISYLYLDGATPGTKRAHLVARFQEGEGQVFLISLKAGGTGLNLTAADYVIHMDPWWNPAVSDQASDRAHRIGQERPLTIVKLVAQGTIEEQVLALHGYKRRLAEAVLAGAAVPTELDVDALEALLARR